MPDLGEPIYPTDVRLTGPREGEEFEMGGTLIYLGIQHDMHVFGLEVNQSWYDMLMDGTASLDVGVLPPHTGIAVRPFTGEHAP